MIGAVTKGVSLALIFVNHVVPARKNKRTLLHNNTNKPNANNVAVLEPPLFPTHAPAQF